jgi:hypothetical protein
LGLITRPLAQPFLVSTFASATTILIAARSHTLVSRTIISASHEKGQKTVGLRKKSQRQLGPSLYTMSASLITGLTNDTSPQLTARSRPQDVKDKFIRGISNCFRPCTQEPNKVVTIQEEVQPDQTKREEKTKTAPKQADRESQYKK